MFFLAKELGMTLALLTTHLTQEELIGWAAFYELKADEEQKTMDNARAGKRAQAIRGR